MNITADEIKEVLLPFATLGAETHDTKFSIRIIDKDGVETGLISHDHFYKAFRLYVELGYQPNAFAPIERTPTNLLDLTPSMMEPGQLATGKEANSPVISLTMLSWAMAFIAVIVAINAVVTFSN